MNILLVEPGYNNKYPPLGLMKISAYHKIKGHKVKFVKGICDLSNKGWDRIYISTIFTFYWDEIIKTISHYLKYVDKPELVFVGGPMASLMGDDIKKMYNVKVLEGLINKPGILGKDKIIVDELTPDYSILDQIEYSYQLSDTYLAYTTRGCIRHCEFCAVPILEPFFKDYIDIKPQIRSINKIYGPKKNLTLLDNNVLASKRFEEIIYDILEIGFHKGAQLNGKLRCVDFNQGVDARLLTKDNMRLLSKIAIRPLRIAFDHIQMKKLYVDKIRMAADYGIVNLSNYILFNFKDSPAEFYERLKINIDLNSELGIKIFSFPMKYVPIGFKDRKYIGSNWNARYLRGVQCVLQATHGVVSPNKSFFEAAFGRDIEEFYKIISMPDDYIIYRVKHKTNGALSWERKYNKIGFKERSLVFLKYFKNRLRPSIEEIKQEKNLNIKNFLKHYVEC